MNEQLQQVFLEQEHQTEQDAQPHLNYHLTQMMYLQIMEQILFLVLNFLLKLLQTNVWLIQSLFVCHKQTVKTGTLLVQSFFSSIQVTS